MHIQELCNMTYNSPSYYIDQGWKKAGTCTIKLQWMKKSWIDKETHTLNVCNCIRIIVTNVCLYGMELTTLCVQKNTMEIAWLAPHYFHEAS